jgi:hypothetical protein
MPKKKTFHPMTKEIEREIRELARDGMAGRTRSTLRAEELLKLVGPDEYGRIHDDERKKILDEAYPWRRKS